MDTSNTPLHMSIAQKHALILEKATLAGIRTVAKSRKVPPQDREDVVNTTCAFAMKARLPVDHEQARKVVNKIAQCACARHMKVDPLGTREGYVEDVDDETGESPTPVADAAPDMVLRLQIGELVEEGTAEFKERFPEYVAAKLTGETSVEVARRRGVTDGHVRKEWSAIAEFAHKHGKNTGMLVLLLVIASVVFPRMAKSPHEVAVPRPDDGAAERPMRHHAPAPGAAELRDRAVQACGAWAWQACADDLDAAAQLDPAGDSPAMKELREAALRNVLVTP
jgi:hypothetical protein